MNVPAGEARKIVTVVFSDVADSTAIGHDLDPESVRRMMSRYFDAMRDVLERHGGQVEKFIGDAVMAVFGVPQAHEDDALRAVRAAAEMRQTLHSLNEEFEQTWGVTVAARTGINSGEVIATGDAAGGEAFVVGDAVNVAARLEQSAKPGEILIGAATYRLVQEDVAAEEISPLAVKGKVDPVPAWTVLEVVAGAPGQIRRLDSPLVGRSGELAALADIFDRTAAGECSLVTLIGPAGVGKSRLTREFLATVDGRARAVVGRCLPYGEGITFWPVAAAVRDAAGIAELDPPGEAREKLDVLVEGHADAEVVGGRLAGLLGVAPAMPGVQESFWAVRKLLEHLAERQPLVVVFDDIHWGEPTFLDLVEYLADWIRGAPILLFCLARPELFEVRAGWTAAKANATLMPLQPLTEAEMDGLIRNLVGGAELAKDARVRIAEVAEGMPLFVEETLRMLVDDGLLQRVNGGWEAGGDLSSFAIPDTIHALLTARLDRLDGEERAVIERASVVGRVFWWRAVSELSPPEVRPRVTSLLQSLVRKELIRPDYSEIAEDDAFRFAHILMRDAAYRGIPKGVRADLHERFADWLGLLTGESGREYEEIVGYHLEQAHRSLLDLGPQTPHGEELGRRAASALGAAGRRAFAMGDMPAAANLLSRATALAPSADPHRFDLLADLAFALIETGDFGRLQEVVAETDRIAGASDDEGLGARAAILALWARLFTDPEGWAAAAQREATRAISVFEELGDERGLSKCWSLLGLFNLTTAQFGPAEDAWQRAARHAHRAGDHREELDSLSWVPICIWAGPTAAEQGLQRTRLVLESAQGDKKAMSSALFVQAEFEAGLGHFDVARRLIAEAKALLQEVALTVWMAGPLVQFAGWIELWAGDPRAAESELRWGHETLGEIGEMAWLPTVAGILAESLYVQERYDESQELTGTIEETAGTEDVYSQVLWRSVRAKIHARRGEADDAERLAREAVDLARETDFLHLHWCALMSLGEVLRLDGRAAEAKTVLLDALRSAEDKGHLVRARLAQDAVEMLDATQC